MKRLLLAVLATAALPLAAQADGLDYNYIQGGYYATNLDGAPDADGWGAAGSAALGSNAQIFGGWSRQNFDNSNVDFDDWNIGAGYHRSIATNTDLVVNGDYRRLSINGFSGDVKTWSGEIGVRGALAPKLEGWVLAGYEDGHNIDGEAYGKLGAQVNLGHNWGLVGEAKFSKDLNQYFIGPRISF